MLWYLLGLSAWAANWPGFRGEGNSVTEARKLPLSWSDRHNLAWKVKLPGFGQSTPVVWNGKIFLTAIEGPKKEKLHVFALSAKSGDILWQKTFVTSRLQEVGVGHHQLRVGEVKAEVAPWSGSEEPASSETTLVKA